MPRYEIVPKIFEQSESATYEKEAQVYPFIKRHFGLLDQSDSRWTTFKQRIEELRTHDDVRVLFLGRHGQGMHNIVREKVGLEDWDENWSKRTRYEDITYAPDPPLSSLGESQADALAKAWKAERAAGAPLPTTWYASPMQRACQTLQRTWSDLVPDVSPLIIEGLRERLGVNLCDKRSTKSVIVKRFPHPWRIEQGFAEEDKVFKDDHRETHDEMDVRFGKALRQILDNDDATYISITAHDEAINSLMRVTGHPPRYLQPGEMTPIVVKVSAETS